METVDKCDGLYISDGNLNYKYLTPDEDLVMLQKETTSEYPLITL